MVGCGFDPFDSTIQTAMWTFQVATNCHSYARNDLILWPPRGNISGSATAYWAILGHPGTGVGPLQEDMAPDGISRFRLCVVSERGRERERERGLGKDRVREQVTA